MASRPAPGSSRPTIYRRWPSKPALVVTALVQSARLAVPMQDTGSLRRDLVAFQRHQVELMNSPEARRITAGLVADLADDPELADTYVSQYLAPRRAQVWQLLQRGIDRGELAADVDLAFIYDLLVGPLFMRAVVWGQPLAARRRRANRRCDPHRLRAKRQRTPYRTTNLTSGAPGAASRELQVVAKRLWGSCGTT